MGHILSINDMTCADILYIAHNVLLLIFVLSLEMYTYWKLKIFRYNFIMRKHVNNFFNETGISRLSNL